MQNVFAFDRNGTFLGKYDVPFETAESWLLWAPSIRDSEDQASILQELCGHVITESERRGVSSVEMILESSHRHYELVHDSLTKAGFLIQEEKAVFKRELGGLLPQSPPSDLNFASAAILDQADLADLCKKSGMSDDDAEELDPTTDNASHWIIAQHAGLPVGVALLEGIVGSNDTVTNRHVGVLSSKRGRGFGWALFVR